MPFINSVLGPLDTGKLGFTLPHEHLTASSAGLPFTYPEVIDREWVLTAAVEDLIQARNGGIVTIVDVSPIDLGRDVELMREVSSQSGMQTHLLYRMLVGCAAVVLGKVSRLRRFTMD